ncbi:hypothetical protein ACFL3V_06165 [Nanoarchaeota archaeon]
MSWFKKLFSMGDSEEDEVEEIQEFEVSLASLSSWVQERSDSEFEKIKPKIEDQFSKISDEKVELKEKLKDLGAADLHNPDIPERERAIMEGNRESYIKQHRQFLNNVDVPEEIDCGWTSQFCKDFEQMLVVLAKSSAKGHAVMNAFFAKHAADVNRSIKTMSDAVSRIKEILEEGNVGVEHLDDVQKAVTTLKAKKKLLTEVGEEEATYTQKLANSKQMMEKLKGKMDDLRQTDSYTEFQDHNAKREELWKRVRSIEDEIDSLFSPLGKPMKKYERMIAQDATLFSKYVSNPVSAVVDDAEFRIITILDKMRNALAVGTLEVKDSEKAMQRISEVSRERLSHLRDSYTDAKGAIKKIDDKLRRCSVLDEINDLQYKLEHTENQVQMLQDKIELSEKTQDKVDLDALKAQVEKKINDAFDVEVKITWPEDSEPV